ncbi:MULTISPECIES: VOC family protein [Nostoc]|uniref:VOC family protein n=1 Tax=Nostoc paludosum FACHB-159 TaxID=2692908 RepID=A0ABR8K5K3_9NOSO|nr:MULTISPECIES: VOC family protein [Nostoc]MBD2681815.1 VOC family protein [Nostoc sp. FACHB-857]MBD2733575.1 VOC family protein [Nostoc paludosum FACHB-159]
MQLELDHIFVCVEPEAPPADLLTAFGLTEGNRRIHQGQGSANVCFFFENAYLELLWLFNINEAQSALVRPTGLWERCRWQETEACPFGISFRSTASDSREIPFPTWDYYAKYLPPQASIPIATNSDNLSEPLIFISPTTKKPTDYALERQLPLVNKIGFKEITALQVTLPSTQKFSAEVRTLIDLGLVQFSQGDFYQLEIEFDNAKEGKSQDFGSQLPILFRW